MHYTLTVALPGDILEWLLENAQWGEKNGNEQCSSTRQSMRIETIFSVTS